MAIPEIGKILKKKYLDTNYLLQFKKVKIIRYEKIKTVFNYQLLRYIQEYRKYIRNKVRFLLLNKKYSKLYSSIRVIQNTFYFE